MVGTRIEKKLCTFLFVALLVATGLPARAVEQREVAVAPAKILFVGNSFTFYNNGLHNHYSALIRSSGREFGAPRVTRILAISGGHLPEHRGGLTSMLESQDWDVVVLQGHSSGPIGDATAEPFRIAAREYSAMIREHGARPVFFMTWAYEGKPEMTDALNQAYFSIASELDAEVVPVGLAFERATAARPDIKLRIEDGKHPTLAGTYLAACTFYAMLFNQSPLGLEYAAELDVESAAYLQSVAWKTVVDYRASDAQRAPAALATR